MNRPTQPLDADEMRARIDALLLSGAARTAAEAESQFLDAHLRQIAELVTRLTDEEFCRHEAVTLLFSHGSRPWEDALP